MVENKFLDKIIHGNSMEILKRFPSESVDFIFTSPPYWNYRDYGVGPEGPWK
jgi:DNA modification methylase